MRALREIHISELDCGWSYRVVEGMVEIGIGLGYPTPEAALIAAQCTIEEVTLGDVEQATD